MSNKTKCLIPIIVGIGVYLLRFVFDLPAEITPNQWLYFSIFLGTITGLILEPIPAALIGLIGIILAVLCKIGPKGSGTIDAKITAANAIKWGLSGFSNTVIWLIFAAFMIGIGYSKSGLGRRISLFLVHKLGKTTLGLGYAIAIVDGILAPFIPSNAARSGGTLYPIISNIPPMFDSHPNDPSTKKIGAYLGWTALATTCVSSSIFLTGQAPNALAVQVAASSGVSVPTWSGWFIAMLPVSIIAFILTPWLTYKIYPPQIKDTKDVSSKAGEDLRKLGKITPKEISMAAISLFGLVFWVGSKQFGVHSTTTAVIIIIAMVLTKILTWDDILSNKPAWNVLVWFGTLVTLAGGLNNTGFLGYLGHSLSGFLEIISPLSAVLGLVLVFYFIHYFFASGTAHVTALLGIFIAIAGHIQGYDASVITLLMLLPMGFMGVLTPYGTGHSPLWYASGYVPSSDFWRLGAIFGIIYMAIYLLIGFPWILEFAYKYAF